MRKKAKRKAKPKRKAATKRKPAKKAKRRVAPKKKVKAKKRKVVKKKVAKKKSKRKPNAAFMKPMKPSSSLAQVIGAKAIPRTQVIKKLWGYIKKHNLQDKVNRRMIIADAKMKPIFGGKKKVNMFEMTKLVNKHLK